MKLTKLYVNDQAKHVVLPMVMGHAANKQYKKNTYKHTYIITYVHTYVNTYIHTYTHTYVRTYLCMYVVYTCGCMYLGMYGIVGTDVCRECCVLSNRGLYDELITRPEQSY